MSNARRSSGSKDSHSVGAAKGKPVGTANQDRIGAAAVRLGHQFHGREIDRCQMVEIVWIRESVDMRRPAGCRHGNPEVVEQRPAADDRFPCRTVGGRHDSAGIQKEVHAFAVDLKTPGLTVVQRRSAAS